jgi:hypothetical protein
MTFRFITPKTLVLSDIAVEADSLDEAFRYYELKYWCGTTPSVSVWQGDTLVAYVTIGASVDGKPPRPVCVLLPLGN